MLKTIPLTEIEKMESEIGYDDGNGGTFDPHKTGWTPLARLYRKGGECLEARSDEEAELLESQGFIKA